MTLPARPNNNTSVCSYCGVGCSYEVVKDKKGRDRVEPLSALGLCVKGQTSLQTGGDSQRAERLARFGLADDRIRAPMIRGHDGEMHEVSWPEALDRAAWLFLHIREWIGPQGVALYGNGQQTVESIWLECLYKLVFKIATIGANSEHCLASAGAAHTLNFGNEASFTWKEFEELSLCDVAVLHGTNPCVTFPQAFEKLKRNRRALKVVIDPVRSHSVIDLEAHDPRTLHIRFEQGGDILFNMAVARVIVDNGWEDKAYLAEAVDSASLQAFYTLLSEARFTAENVAERIVLAGETAASLAATIRRYAALVAQPDAHGVRPRPAFVSSMGINQSTGSFGFSSNLNLLLLTGNVGRRGAGSMRIAGQSNATSELMLGMNSRKLIFNLDPKNEAHRREVAEALALPVANIPASFGTPVARMGEDDLLYCFIFMGTQMTRNMPRLGQWKKRLGRAFNIVIDSFLPDGALDHADVILPAFTYTERTGVIQRGDRTLQLQQRVSDPPALAWSDDKILVQLALAIAKRLRDSDTAALADLDPDVIERAFGRYADAAGDVAASGVFDHVVSTSQKLGLYNTLVDGAGTPISHTMLREQAGAGVQWQGDGRYADARTEGAVFPALRLADKQRAKLVLPPEDLLARLVERSDDKLRSLITGRGRPGKHVKSYVARYNSGIKTMSISGMHDETYWIEVHPDYAAREGLGEGELVRVSSQHGAVVAKVSLNANAPEEFPFLDFVAGQTNRLTDYEDHDRFTNQSFIKRTPVRLEKLAVAEHTLHTSPSEAAFVACVDALYTSYRATYPDEEDMERFARGEEGGVEWLPWQTLRAPQNAEEHALAERLGQMVVFLQRYADDATYRAEAARMLLSLPADTRTRLLFVLLPLLRRLDYTDILVKLLSDLTPSVPMRDKDGNIRQATLLGAHKSAVLELKEEVVAVQLFVAIKRGLAALYGVGMPVPREDIALISGIAIPCAGDVPAYFMGISPADLASGRLIHSRATGTHAIIVVDRKHNRAVKVDVLTGVLPKDKELIRLRSRVIVQKRAATGAEHRRFFDRLAELITTFVRVDDGNFRVVGPVALPFAEFRFRFGFSPAHAKEYREFVRRARPTRALTLALRDLEFLDAGADSALIEELVRDADHPAQADSESSAQLERSGYLDLIHDTNLSPRNKVQRVIDAYVGPVLENDGGKLDLVGFDEKSGEVSVRFVGSCANCPCSMLSLESVVAPPLLNIPGVTRVVHRQRLRSGELEKLVGEGLVMTPKPRRKLPLMSADPVDPHA